MKAVRFDQYGGIDVLHVADVPTPEPGPGEVLVRVKAAGINPGEAKVREGMLHERWPATFPSGQGTDLAGTVEGAGPGATGLAGVTFAVGQDVIGWVDTRSSQAEYALVEAANLVPKPPEVPFEVAGAIPVAGFTAWAAVRAVGGQPGEVIVVAGAAGGVGSIAVQLARSTGATVVGLASPANHGWLTDHGVIPVTYGDGAAERIKAAAPGGKADALIDTHGGGYVELAVNELGIAPERVDTIAAFDAVAKYGIKAEGNAAGASAGTLAELAALLAEGDLEIPIEATYPIEEVQEAFRHLDGGHVRGKIVLLP